MYYSPFYIKRYRTTAPANCIIKGIRKNTLYKYDKNGLLKSSNPTKLICRNEVGSAIYLRNKLYYSRMNGAVTAILLKEDKNSDSTIITTIAYHDFGGIMWFLLFIGAGIIYLFNKTENIWSILIPIVVISILFGLLNSSGLKRQRIFIESIIKQCELN
jgi:hypothetical protein